MNLGRLILLMGAAEEEERRKRHHYAVRIRRRHIRDTNNPLDLPEEVFVRLFRLSREVAAVLIHGIEVDVGRVRPTGLPVNIVVLTAVRFFVEGNYQRCIGKEYNLALGQTTVSKSVREVSMAIVRRLFHVFVKFPADVAERTAVTESFLLKFGLPDCLGCIDCTHIAILAPKKNNPEDPANGYKNTMGFYSINTQFVCDVNGRLLNVNARYPGSTLDQFIFNASVVKREMDRLTSAGIGKHYLIGDSGYEKEPYLITPILPTPQAGSPEHKYNMVLSQVRHCVRRTNGMIRDIFRCMRRDKVFHYQPTAAAYIILSCYTIYNMMHEFRLPLPDVEEKSEDENLVDANVSVVAPDENVVDADVSEVAPDENVVDADVTEVAPGAPALQRQQEIIEFINEHL